MLEQQAEAFLRTQTHLVLASINEAGDPWAVPLKIQSRIGLRFEWESKSHTVHSRAIALHPNVSICLYQKSAGEQQEMVVYGTGVATVVTEFDEGLCRYAATLTEAWFNSEDHIKRQLDVTKFGVQDA